MGNYHDEVWCDIILMQATHLLLGRPWQFDRDVTHHGKLNKYSLVHKGRKFTLAPLDPKVVRKDQIRLKQFCEEVGQKNQKKEENIEKAKIKEALNRKSQNTKGQGVVSDPSCEKKRAIQNIYTSAKDVRKAPYLGNPCILVRFRDYCLSVSNLNQSLPSVFVSLLQYFNDVLSNTPGGLPSKRGIEHQIDLIPESSIPNRAPYKCGPDETKELEKQVGDLLNKGYIRESLSPCAVPVILVPKKDDTYRMCVDCHPITKITIKYRHPIPYGYLYFDDEFYVGDMGCEIKKTERKEAKSEKSYIYGPILVREEQEVKVTRSPEEKDKSMKSEFIFHYTCSSRIVSLFQDFVEPLRGAQLNHSTYDKDSVPMIFNRIPFVGLDSRTNPFEERGNDTCMRRPQQYTWEKNLQRLFGWDPGIKAYLPHK